MTLLLVSFLNAQDSLFTYQGRLDEEGRVADGPYDFEVQLFDGPAPRGRAVSQVVAFEAVAVTKGVFQLDLDFGSEVFGQSQRHLEIKVRRTKVGEFVTLQPRQRLGAAPNAIYAEKAGGLAGGVTAASIVDRSGDTMTGTLEVNGPGGTAILSRAGALLGEDVAVNGRAESSFGRGVVGSASGDSGTGVVGQATGSNGVGVSAIANDGPQAKGIHASSTTGLAGYFEGPVEISYDSPFAKPQLHISDPNEDGWGRIRMQTGGEDFWDIAVGGEDDDNNLRFYRDGVGDVAWITPEGQLHTRVLTIMGGADIAEPFEMSHEETLSPGTVVVIDEDRPGQLKASEESYDTKVAGVISGAGGVRTGLQLQQEGVLEGGQPVALTGRVYVRADATNGIITPGDLLTTSSRPGQAMKVTDFARAQGAILGKAMTRLEGESGLVLVLVTLQ